MRKTNTLQMVFFVAAMTSLVAPWLVGSSLAHTPTALVAQNPRVCVGAGGGVLTILYDAVQPTDRDWSVRLRIGLDGGDATASTIFAFYLWDNSDTTEERANWGAAVTNWLQNPGYSFQGQLESHVGGTMTLWSTISNKDAVSQCYFVYARAFHSTD